MGQFDAHPRKRRKLWRVTTAQQGQGILTFRPDSQAQAYRVYLPNNWTMRRDWTRIWVDERDGRGWQLYEYIEHPGGVMP